MITPTSAVNADGASHTVEVGTAARLCFQLRRVARQHGCRGDGAGAGVRSEPAGDAEGCRTIRLFQRGEMSGAGDDGDRARIEVAHQALATLAWGEGFTV